MQVFCQIINITVYMLIPRDLNFIKGRNTSTLKERAMPSAVPLCGDLPNSM